MRRTIFLALLAALLLAPSAFAQDKITRDCYDDGVLQGKYTASELRAARNKLPTDVDEYSDCRDVLSRAIAAATADANKTPTPTATAAPTDTGATTAGGDTTGGDTGATGGDPSTSTTTTDTAKEAEREQILSAPSSPQDAAAVASAYNNGDKAIKAELNPKNPGEARLTASVGRNGLPASMIAVLVLVAATLVAACLPLIRRRRVFRHPPA
jgi:hypothetical protein